MSLINSIKRFLGLEKKEEAKPETISSEQPISVPQNSVQPAPEQKREFLDIKCEICGNIIGQDKRKKLSGKIYHRNCIKKQYKMMKEQGKAF